jgi:hypothetical protein
MDFDLTKRVLAALEREQVRYVIFGAVALNLLGLPRATEDLDIFIAPEADNIERLKTALRSVFDDPCIDEITSEDLLGEYPAIQYAPPQEGFHIDILTRLGDLFAFDTVESQRLDLEGLQVSVVTLEQLYRMKKGTVRPKDWGDAARIAERLDIEDK